MNRNYSLKERMLAMALSVIMVLGMLPAGAAAETLPAVAQIGEVTYTSLTEAFADVPTGTNQAAPTEATTIQLLSDTAYAFDVGKSTGSATMNLVLDLNGNTLTLSPSVGSVGTKTNGIRVLAFSKLEVKNGTLLCSDDAADNVKVGIANYGELVLDSVALKSGKQTIYTVNNRGALTLKGTTSITDGTTCAITNDPYNLYYTTDVDASVTCDSAEVSVGTILVERYARDSANKGGVKLNISAGSVKAIKEDGNSALTAEYNITGGSFGSDISAFCANGYQAVKDDSGSYVVKSTQKDFGFAQDTYTVSFGDNDNKFAATAANAIGDVTYSIEGETDVAVIDDETTGTVTIHKAGEVVVKATAAGDAQHHPAEDTYTLKVNKGNQQIAFHYPDPVADQWIGESFTNAVSGGDGKGAVSYWLVDGENLVEEISGVARINKDSGEVTFLCVGKQITVKAVKAADDCYDEASATYSVTAKKLEPTVGFETSGPINITYDPEKCSFKNPVIGTDESDKISWSVNGSSDAAELNTATGELKIKQAGSITVQATVEESSNYTQKTIEYTLNIAPADQAALVTNQIPDTIIYSPDAQKGLIVGAGGSGTGAYGYEILEGNEFAQIDALTGEIKVQKAGNFEDGKFKAGSIKVKITKAADACYNAAEPAEVIISLVRAAQSGFGFADNGKAVVTYNDNGNKFERVASGGQSGENVVYTSSNEEVATVDQKGTVNIHKAGTVTVTATKPADDKYEQTSDSYELTINLDTQNFTFEDGRVEDSEGIKYSVDLLYGIKSYRNPVRYDSTKYPDAKFSYSIEGDDVGASIADDGTITFADSATSKKVGIFTVTATMVEDEHYEAYPLSYEVNVKYLEVDEKPYAAYEDGAGSNAALWFNGDVYIHAPGYQLSQTGNAFETSDWEGDKVKFAAKESDEQAATVYLKNDAGHMTDAIVVGGIHVDTEAPEGLTISYSEPVVSKVFDKITFGFYQPSVTVTLTAEDVTSGVDFFEWSYTKEAGSSDKNAADQGGTITTGDITYSADSKTATASFTIPANARGYISATVTDRAGNTADTSHEESNKVVVDDKDPELTPVYVYTDNQKEDNEHKGIYYTQGDTEITFIVTEANFDLSLLTAEDEEANQAPVVKINGKIQEGLAWKQGPNADQWKATLPVLSGNGVYRVELSYTDRSGNKTEYAKELHIDNVPPVIELSYDDEEQNNRPKNTNHFKANRTATIKITEENFEPEEVKLTVSAKDVTGENDVNISSKGYAAYAANAANWFYKNKDGNLVAGAAEAVDPDEHYLVLPVFDIDAAYSLNIEYADLAENEGNKISDKFVIDHHGPTALQISYSEAVVEKIIQSVTFGFYQPSVTVTLTAEDVTSGVDFFEWSYTKEAGSSDKNAADQGGTITTGDITYSEDGKTATASFTVPANARGYISATATDRAGNKSEPMSHKETNTVIVDAVSPSVSVSYQADSADTVCVVAEDGNCIVDSLGNNIDVIYNGDVTATVTIDEANFFEGVKAEDGVIHQVGIKLTKTDDEGNETVIEYLPSGAAQRYMGARVELITWTHDGDIHTATIPYTDNADYVLEVEYTDLSTNEADITTDDGLMKEKSNHYTSKVISVDKVAPVVSITYDNTNVISTVGERKYFGKAQNAVITVMEHNFCAAYTQAVVSAVNAANDPVAVANFAAQLADEKNWTHEGNEHTAKVSYTVDANYTFDIDTEDLARNPSADYKADAFTVDTTASAGLKIAYSQSVTQKIINAITFGFYQPEVTVTLTADDITAGVDFFEWTYTKEAGSSDQNAADRSAVITTGDITYGADGKTATASFTIPANARGYISAAVTDRSGNAATTTHEDSGTVIVDALAPSVSVSYQAKSADTRVQFVDAKKLTVDSFEKGTDAIYNGDVTATVTIDEANFFEGVKAEDGVIHQVGIKLTKTDDEGNETVIEYLPSGAAQRYMGARVELITWTHDGDIHTATIPYTDNADYVLEVEYTDLSANDAGIAANDGLKATGSYTSKVVTVDKIAPVIEVAYENTDVINTVGERKYFDKIQSAVITVTEHNFRAADMKAVVSAVNAVNDPVAVANFAAQLADEKNWTHEGNVHTAKISYTVDANYTFDIGFADLAQNASADYKADAFTVDTTIPANLTVSYSTNVFEEILESVTFGYYNAQMTVTVTAEDETSGIYHFAYSYIKEKNVSEVNAELLDQAIRAAEITYEGKRATATFNIPKMVLGNDNQFNGTVSFTAYDRSENSKDLVDATRIVVDNITPTAAITYNHPVNNTNGISYYDGNITATITVKEANFDSGDVVVTVTKDGQNYPTQVAWKDEDVDTHIGSFILTQDGDYVVSVQYTDKSGNRMADYKSNELTLDTTAPTVRVSNIKANSANKDEKYGFTITFHDTNLNAATVKPLLKAVKQTQDGAYQQVDVDLGKAAVSANGQTHTYTIEDLPDDGLYTLICEVQDMSANGMTKIILDDSETYDQVQFSINRNGSTFGYGNSFTEKLVEQYYVYSVDEDVVIEEINVDPVENYKLSLNGFELVEGTDYTTQQTSNAGEWSKRTYTVKKELLQYEGEYSIIVSSTDKTETTAFSDILNLSLAFVVDQSKPVLTITGLEAGGRYQTDAQTVTLIPTDEGGRLNSLTVLVMDSNGDPLKDGETGEDISLRFEMSGEELLMYLEENDGKVTFTIPEGLNNRVKIICNDCAVSATGLTNEYNELFEKVTVSQNQLVIFYANTPLFVGTIVGVLALIALIIFLVKRKKDKKSKTAVKA